MSIYSHKCPNCGAPIEFNPDLQKISCEYCLSSFEPKEVAAFNAKEEKKPIKAKGYHCDSCGAEVVSDDETTSSTFCYYCHNPVILTDMISGEFAPDFLIPFKISKEKAKEKFLAWAKKHKYIPRSFYSESQLEKITGLYLPYWQTRAVADVDIVAKGNKQKTWTSGQNRITETSVYSLDRQGEIEINNISEIDTQKIEKPLIQSIEPYRMSEKEDFSMIYLSGFYAQTYDQGREKILPVIEAKAHNYIEKMVEDVTAGYTGVTYDKRDVDYKIDDLSYCLLPAWILTYQYRGKTYVYAMNGQSGEAFGELPVDNTRLSLTSVFFFIVVAALLIVGGRFIW